MNRFSIKYAKHILILAIFIALSSTLTKDFLVGYQKQLAQLNQIQNQAQNQDMLQQAKNVQLQNELNELIKQQVLEEQRNNEQKMHYEQNNIQNENNFQNQYQQQNSEVQETPKDEKTILKEKILSASEDEKIILKRQLVELYKQNNNTYEAISELEDIFYTTKDKQDFISLENLLLENKNFSKMKQYYHVYKNTHPEADFEVDSFENLF